MARVLVVDDEPQLARAVSRQLGAVGHDVTVVFDGQSALDLAAVQGPELVVLDLNLPDIPGVTVIAQLRTWLKAPVLVLSGITEEWQKVAALEAGADDYLVKPFGVPELRARVSALLRRPTDESNPQAITAGELRVDLAHRALRVAGDEVRLTPTEWRLLEGFVSNPGKLLTHRWLLNHAWTDSYGAETREALRVHIRALRAKLKDDAADPRYIRTESGTGYRWTGDDSSPAPAPAPDRGGMYGGELDLSENRSADADKVQAAGDFHQLNNILAAVQLIAFDLAQLGAQGDETAVGLELARVDALVNEAAEVLERLRRL